MVAGIIRAAQVMQKKSKSLHMKYQVIITRYVLPYFKASSNESFMFHSFETIFQSQVQKMQYGKSVRISIMMGGDQNLRELSVNVIPSFTICGNHEFRE